MFTAKGVLMLVMFIAGGLAASQAAINAQLSSHIGNPFQASFMSFCVGALALGLLLVGTQQGLPALNSFKQMPSHYLLGGLFGSVFITCAIFLVPRIGVVNVLFLGLAGQMIVSIAIDSFGLFGVKPQQMSTYKIIGLALILSGVAFLKLGGTKFEETLSNGSGTSTAPVRFISHLNNAHHSSNFNSATSAIGSPLLKKRQSFSKRRKHKAIAHALKLRLTTNA